eukprot:6227398-Ditylum_brightwellii.AAC.1
MNEEPASLLDILARFEEDNPHSRKVGVVKEHESTKGISMIRFIQLMDGRDVVGLPLTFFRDALLLPMIGMRATDKRFHH